MTALDNGLLARVARAISRPSDAASHVGSILAQAATSYGARPVINEATVPTGFDPVAAALFEATVEVAFLVANADGDFDPEERAAFRSVVAEACHDLVEVTQIEALLTDLTQQLAEDGVDRRCRIVTRMIFRQDHQREILRIAALMAHISGGVSVQERALLGQLARGFSLDAAAVDQALTEAEAALAED